VRLFLDPAALEPAAEQCRKQYRSAELFPHVVLDGVLPEAALDLALDAFPSPDSNVCKEYTTHSRAISKPRAKTHRRRAVRAALPVQLGALPALSRTPHRHPGPVPDPYFSGGGLHQIERDGKPGIHADFSCLGELPLECRLNALVFLNRDRHDERGAATSSCGTVT
jgi:hypothetical protein